MPKLIEKLTETEYLEHVATYDGLCTACGVWTLSGVEPDAENLPCENDRCAALGLKTVMGAENALLAGHIEIED